jgi:phosphoglycolate phosphatase
MEVKQKVINILDYDLVIFDLDGTLVDTAPDIVETIKYILNYFDCEMKTDEEIIRSIGGGARKVLLKSMGDKGEENIDEALVVFRDYYIENCAIKSTLYPYVTQLLDFLKKNHVRLAICTLKIKEATLRILSELRLVDYFDMIITADDISVPKPDPQGILKILDQLKISTDRAVIIGDTVSDIMAGKNGNIETVGVIYGYDSQQAIENAKPGFIIKNLIELLGK